MKKGGWVMAMLMGALMIGAAHAEIWKCTNSETGRIEYSGTPCSGRNSTGDRINARPRESTSSAAAASAQAARPAGGEAAASAPLQAGNSQPAGDGSDCATAESAYDAAKGRRAAPAVLQPLKSKVTATCGRPPASAARAGVAQTAISSCDGSGCWDVNGNRYNAGGGNTYFSAEGQTCRKVANQLQC